MWFTKVPKGIIIIRKSKDRQCNDQKDKKIMHKRPSDIQNATQKITDCSTKVGIN